MANRIALLVPALLVAAAGGLHAENDLNTCTTWPDLPQCRALEAAIVSGTQHGAALPFSFDYEPSVFFVGSTMYLQTHHDGSSPAGVVYCSDGGHTFLESTLLWKKTGVTPTNVYSPATFVRRTSPCGQDLGVTPDPNFGVPTGGGGGVRFRGSNGNYYQVNGTYYSRDPNFTDGRACTVWNNFCFPGTWAGIASGPEAFPRYMQKPLLALHTGPDGVFRGFNVIKLAGFSPAPPSSVFPKQFVYNQYGNVIGESIGFGYVQWGPVGAQFFGAPNFYARVQVLYLTGSQAIPPTPQPAISLRAALPDSTGVWRLVPEDGKLNFVPERYDLTGLPFGMPFHDAALGGWRVAYHDHCTLVTSNPPLSVCDETAGRIFGGSPGAFPASCGGVSVNGVSSAAHRALASASATVYTGETTSLNGWTFGITYFRIPGYAGLYVLRGSSERICLQRESPPYGNKPLWWNNWWSPFISEVTVERVQ